MPKRKSPSQHDEEPPLRRSTRQKTSAAPVAVPKPPKSSTSSRPANTGSGDNISRKAPAPKVEGAKKATAKTKAKDQHKEPPAKARSIDGAKAKKPSSPEAAKAETEPKAEGSADGSSSTGRQYWLMKAEPESRIENGIDVKFSIDDLASKKEPEPWDGIRNFVARNNLRAMKKGDLAFFYHSNCKEPGIVGTMEVVREHSPDLSAHDPKTPYYDPKSSPSNPKWSVVHVDFRSKFDVQIGLKELREMGVPGRPLENMQMLKQSRLSVSKVSEPEWEYLIGVAEEKAKSA